MHNLKCKICGIYFESHKYYAHLLKDHGVTNVLTDIRLKSNKKQLSVLQSSIRTKTKSNKKKLSKKKKIQNKPTFYPDKRIISEKLDGSKGWHNIRDHGQFGSFPSFEPMDDDD